MIRIIGPRDKRDPAAINTTSSASGWSRGLSPFFLGPCQLYAGHVSLNMENAWQYSKVYHEHQDALGEPSPAYWSWAKSGWNRVRADRYPMGKGKTPLYSLWDGEKLSYIEARRRIYLELYQKAVTGTDAFSHLKKLYQERGTLTLFDFDGYDHLTLGMSLEDVLRLEARKMGHAFVLAMMLDGKI